MVVEDLSKLVHQFFIHARILVRDNPQPTLESVL